MQWVLPLHRSCPLHTHSEQAEPCFPPARNHPPGFCSSWELLWPERQKRQTSGRCHHTNLCSIRALGRAGKAEPVTTIHSAARPNITTKHLCPKLDSAEQCNLLLLHPLGHGITQGGKEGKGRENFTGGLWPPLQPIRVPLMGRSQQIPDPFLSGKDRPSTMLLIG